MINSSSSDTDQCEEIRAAPLYAGTDVGAEPLPAELITEKTPAEPTEPPAAGHHNPPDGGLQAWLQVLGGTFTLVATWGLVNSFGVFQTFYETSLLAGRNTSSDISWIGSLQGALLMIFGVVSGPLYDAGHFRHLLAAGLFLIVLGMFMTSLATAYWQLLLAQGVCVGIGMGMVFLPSTAILAQYFSKKLPLV